MMNEFESTQIWCTAVIDILSVHDPHGIFHENFVRLLDTIVESKDFKSLKRLQKELQAEYICEFSEAELATLESKLTQAGVGLSLKTAPEKDIKVIISRGKIMNDEEYRQIENHISSNPELEDFIELNNMLTDYYKSK